MNFSFSVSCWSALFSCVKSTFSVFTCILLSRLSVFFSNELDDGGGGKDCGKDCDENSGKGCGGGGGKDCDVLCLSSLFTTK